MSRTLKAALIGVVLSATALPVMAAPPHIGFTPFGWRTICIKMTDYQVRQEMARKGFTNIYLNSPFERQVEVRATMDGWVYLMEVSLCTGEILESRQLRPA